MSETTAWIISGGFIVVGALAIWLVPKWTGRKW